MGADTTSLMMGMAVDMAVFARHTDNLCWSVDDGGWIYLTGIEGLADFNIAALTADASVDLLDRYVAEVRGHGLSAILVIDGDADVLTTAAGDHGLTKVGAMPLMLRDAAPVVRRPTDLTVRVATPEDHPTVVELVAEAFSFDLPVAERVFPVSIQNDVEVMIVLDGETIVGTGWFVTGGRRVGVYNMATPARLQRRGIGRAVLEAGMSHHVAEGVDGFMLGATEAGRHLYDQVGFEVKAEPNVYVIGASTQFPGEVS